MAFFSLWPDANSNSTIMKKPLKFHQTLNQTPRSVAHGKHRRSNTPSHRGPSIRAGKSTRGSNAIDSIWSSGYTWYGADFAAEPKHPTIPYAGIRTGEIIGHRLWWVLEEAGEQWICSLAHRQLWAPDETISADLERVVDGGTLLLHPIWGGIYAFNDDPKEIDAEIDGMRKAVAYIQEQRRIGRCPMFLGWHGAQEANAFVRGTVRMWGEVIEHETGWRSQFAKLNSIDQMYGPGDIDALRARYLGS